MKGGEAEFFLENEKIAPRQAMQRGSGLIPPIQGRSRRARETIEATLGEIHVHDQFDQSSRNFTGDCFWDGYFFSAKLLSGNSWKRKPNFSSFLRDRGGKKSRLWKKLPKQK